MMKRQDGKKRLEFLSGTVYIRIGEKFELKIPAVMWLTTLILLMGFLILWVSDVDMFGCHKKPMPLPMKKAVRQ